MGKQREYDCSITSRPPGGLDMDRAEIVKVALKSQGFSDAKVEYMMREDAPQWPSPTKEALKAEAAKWSTLSDLQIEETSTRVRVSVKREGLPQRMEVCLDLERELGSMRREYYVEQFYALTLLNLERLGNPRWDALVREENP